MKRLLTILMALVIILGVNAFVHAETILVTLNAYTEGRDDSIRFIIDVVDRVTHPPNRVTSIIITAPDGTVFDQMGDFIWLNQDTAFYLANKYAEDFDGGVIPDGLYTVNVQDKNGNTFTATDNVIVNFLAKPVITSPGDGSTLSSLTPTLKWTAVSGAEAYRIHLWNENWNDAVWWWYGKRKYCNLNKLKIPKGILWSGYNYRLQIQARDSLKDTDNRASSDQIYFTAP